MCFTCMSLNCRSTQIVIKFQVIDTFALHIELPSYSEPYRKDRKCHGGGSIMYLNSELVHSRKAELEVYSRESIWVEIKVKIQIS